VSSITDTSAVLVSAAGALFQSDRTTRLCYASCERTFDEREATMARDGNQLMLPLEAAAPARPAQLGPSSVEYGPVRSILTTSSGFIDAFDYTLNPYSGCTFGCSYCYAAALVCDQGRRERWGQWVRQRERARAAQYLHAQRGQFVAGTRAAAVALCRERGWDEAAYRRTVDVLRASLPHMDEGRDGFVPM
jgi:hypothetical protein